MMSERKTVHGCSRLKGNIFILRLLLQTVRLDFRRPLVSGLRPSPEENSGEERGLLSRTAAGNRLWTGRAEGGGGEGGGRKVDH